MPPEFAVIAERERYGFKVVEIDTKKATYQGMKWQSMGSYGRRKFENLLVLNNVGSRLKIIYK